ncbi:MAG: molybdopterin oxidoreductase family protein [Actinobacteria bacterium]|nr:MAG: molybdopterin oxidoreductase family protein [Actinomycetota bacterium]
MAVAHRTCPFCEATCGLEVEYSNGRVTKVRGDADDVFSKGFICPKGVSLMELHDDPDRLRTPMIRTEDGAFREASWEEALALIAEKLPPLLEAHGRDACAVYLGNPSAHSLAASLYGRPLLKAIGTKNVYSASTVDQYPKQMASALMFGTATSVPVPDLDRTDFLLILGANPLASNGSLMTAPDVRCRLRAIRARGGKIVVVDPRRTRTAKEADEHLFIRPGTDALLLFALANVIFEEGLATPVDHLAGLDEVHELARAFTPDAVAGATGIDAAAIRRLARELAGAPAAAVYGRIGTTTQLFGTTASWLVDVLNAITGNLDRPGGAMFTRAAAGQANTRGEGGSGRGVTFGRWSSRVRGLGEIFGELPVATLGDEIETPGEGQVRALITIAGNPVVSTPNAGRLDAALASLDFMVSVDIYVNETTRHADVILPAPSPVEKPHYDLALYMFAVRNVANYSPPLMDPPDGMLHEWETLLALTAIVAGQGPDADLEALDDLIAAEVGRLNGVEPDAALRGPERLLDMMLRAGPYKLTLADLKAAPHGIDLGPLEPRLPEALRTPSGLVELAPAQIVADVPRLQAAMAEHVNGGMVLVGRRDLRSNNSWMHNLPLLVSGPERCTAWLHPDDVARFGLVAGDLVSVSSRTGAIELPFEMTEDVMPGVVSIPHGWGHAVGGVRLRVAADHAGANSNVLADELLLDPVSGNAVLNGIPVEVAAVRQPAAMAQSRF